MVGNALAASLAYWGMFESHMKNIVFKEVNVLGTWFHDPGVFHIADPVTVPIGLQGMKIRGAPRVVKALFEKQPAEPSAWLVD